MISDWRAVVLLPTGERVGIYLYPAGYIKFKITGPDRLAVEDMWHSQEQSKGRMNGQHITEIYLYSAPVRPLPGDEPPPRTFSTSGLNDGSTAVSEPFTPLPRL